jgi:phospholipid/cholesterol/gamma-HCH transport system substrate-binding protein
MQQKSGNKIKLGIFVSVGMLLFITAIYYIGKRQQLFNPTFRVSGIFKDISGLEVGNNVRFSGINVGIIENVEIVTDSTVRVDFMINESVRKFIKKDVKAIIGSDGLMGNKILIITPGTTGAKVIADNDYIKTAVPVNMDEIMAKLKITTDNAAVITSDLAVIMTNIREGRGTIGKLFMDTVFAENIDKTIVNLKQGAGGFNQTMDAAKHSFLLRGFLKKKKKDDDKKDGDKKNK